MILYKNVIHNFKNSKPVPVDTS